MTRYVLNFNEYSKEDRLREKYIIVISIGDQYLQEVPQLL